MHSLTHYVSTVVILPRLLIITILVYTIFSTIKRICKGNTKATALDHCPQEDNKTTVFKLQITTAIKSSYESNSMKA